MPGKFVFGFTKFGEGFEDLTLAARAAIRYSGHVSLHLRLTEGRVFAAPLPIYYTILVKWTSIL